MADLRGAGLKITSLLWIAGLLVFATSASAQSTRDNCAPASVIPLTGAEPKAKITVYPPLAGPLASRGVAIIEYCAQNLHIVPVFGPDAVAATPRVGHLHVTVDDASWHWADASGNPIILQSLTPGPHKVLIELADGNHHILDKGTITFTVPEKAAAEKHPKAPVTSWSWQELRFGNRRCPRSAADYFNNLKDDRNLFATAAYFFDSGIAST